MFIKTDYTDCSYITAGRPYHVIRGTLLTHSAIIIDDVGDQIGVTLDRASAHLHYNDTFTKVKLGMEQQGVSNVN